MEGSPAADLARAVLTDAVTRDDVDDAMVGAGFRLVNVIDALPGRPSQLLFARDAGASYVYVIDDLRLGVTYLAATRGAEARGQGALSPSDVLAEITRTLPCHQPSAHRELLASLDDGGAPDDDERMLGLGLALLVLTEPDADGAAPKIRAALAHPASRVRAAALTAVTYAPKPELAPSLLAMRTSDPDPSLREAAARVLESLFSGGATA